MRAAGPSQPGTPPDEHFHRFITEQLDEWGRSNLPGLEVVRVVGQEWAARSHELRELLGRNGIPFGFYPADSPDGQRLVEEAGAAGKALPTVVPFDGRVLADPSNAEVGEAIGVQTKPGGGCYDVTVIGAVVGAAGAGAAGAGAVPGEDLGRGPAVEFHQLPFGSAAAEPGVAEVVPEPDPSLSQPNPGGRSSTPTRATWCSCADMRSSVQASQAIRT